MNPNPDYEYLAARAPAMHRQFKAVLAAQAAFEEAKAIEAKASNASDWFAYIMTCAEPADAAAARAAWKAHAAALRELAAATLETARQLTACGLVR